MAKLTLTDLTSLTSESSAVAAINANNTLIENALDNTISRDGTSPNEMESDLDLNSFDILNVNSINVESMTLDGYVITRDSFGDITAVSVSEGSWKENCATATTAAITLSGEQTIADVTTSSSRVLVKNQADATTNGIYVSAAGAWTRAEDFDSTADIEEGAIVYVDGDAAAAVGDKIWLMSSSGTIVLGTSSLNFSAITSPVRFTTFKNITTAEYTLLATDRGKQLVWSGSTDCFVTLPANSEVRIGAGSEVEFLLAGTGTITFLAGTGATIRTPYSESITRQWGVAKAKKKTQTEWHLSGEILAVGDFGKDWLEAETATAATVLFGGNLEDIHALADPNADRFLGWDDSAGAVTYFTFGTGLSVSGTSVTVSLGWDDLTGDPSDSALFVAHTHDDRYYTEAEVDALVTGFGGIALSDNNVWTGTNSFNQEPTTFGTTTTDLSFDGFATVVQVTFNADTKWMQTYVMSGVHSTGASNVFAKTRHATPAGHTKVEVGDSISDWWFYGDDGVASQLVAYLATRVSGATSAGNVPAAIEFWTSNTNTAGLALRYTFGSLGQFQIGASADAGTAGYIFRSGGASAAPTWATPATIKADLDLEIGTDVQAYDADLAAIAALAPSNDDIIQRKAGAWTNRTMAQLYTDLSSLVKPVECLIIAASDETTALTTGTAKTTFRMPYAMTLTAVRASVTTAPTGGTLLTVDINESGTTILSTKLTFDASEKTTTTAATAAVISDSSLADDAEITIDIDAVGSTIAGAGLKVYLIGTRT